MNVPLKYVLLAATGFIVLGGFAIWQHGKARYDEGVAFCQALTATTATAAANESAKNLEKTTNETAAMSDSAIDDDLANLGIMRNAADR